MINILKDKTNKVLFRMSIPISLGMISTFLFQVVDTYFVGNLGANELAALSYSSTLYFLLVSLFIGLSIGVSIIIGQAVGKGELDEVKKTTWIALVISSFLSIILSFISILFIDTLFNALGVSSEVLPFVKSYMIPVLFGMPLLTTAIMASGILRASGNITSPEIIMGLGGVINLILDYALIFGKWGMPEMGIQGASYASVISWVAIFIGMVILLLKDDLLTFSSNSSTPISTIYISIFKLSSPTILTQIIGPVTITFITFFLAKQSSMAVAAFGVVSRMEMLLLIGVLGVSSSITPFIAQNTGAKLHSRVDEAIIFGGKASTYIGLFLAIFLFIFVKPMAALFSDNNDIINHIVNYFYIISLSYIFYAFYIITTSIFNGLKRTTISLKITAVKSIIFILPLVSIGSIWGVSGIFIGIALANILIGLYATKIMRKEIKINHPSLSNPNVLEDYKQDAQWVLGRIKAKK